MKVNDTCGPQVPVAYYKIKECAALNSIHICGSFRAIFVDEFRHKQNAPRLLFHSLGCSQVITQLFNIGPPWKTLNTCLSDGDLIAGPSLPAETAGTIFHQDCWHDWNEDLSSLVSADGMLLGTIARVACVVNIPKA